jgi:hypothetical protein
MKRLRDRYLILALHDRSWGRTGMAASVAEELEARGAAVLLLAHASAATLLRDRGVEHALATHALGPLTKTWIERHVAEMQPRAVLLCDYFGNCNYLHRMGVASLEFLSEGRPVVAVDLWDFERTGWRIDRADGRRVPLCLADSESCRSHFLACRRWVPVPVAPPTGRTPRANCLPRTRRAPDAAAVRRGHGLRPGDALVLTTTSDWQHRDAGDEDELRLARHVPRRIARALAALDPRVHWIHVGPRPFDLGASPGPAYRWLPPMPARELDDLVASSDLVLSPNLSASTTSRAIRSGVPVLLVHSSRDLPLDPDEIREAASPRGESGRAVLRPFLLWPLGYRGFLGALTDGNPWMEAVRPVELGDSARLVESAAALLGDRRVRERADAARADFVRSVEALPTPADLILSTT